MFVVQRLPANDEALNQRFGKTGGAHAPLDGGNVVGNAPEFYRLMFQVGNGEAGARVPIARLANRAGIKEIPPRPFDAERGERFRSSRANLQHFEIGILVREAALVMGMSEKSDLGAGVKKPIESLRGREHVLIFILKRAVYQNDSIGGQGSLRKRGKPGKVFGVQLRASPIHGRFRHGIEVGGVHQAGYSFVMIAANRLCAEFAEASDNLVRIGPIANDITETHGNVPAAVRGIQSSGEGCGVCVKIA